MKELIIDYLLAENEHEVEVTMKEMSNLISTSNPEIKSVFQAIVSAKIKLVSKEINRVIAEADKFIEKELQRK